MDRYLYTHIYIYFVQFGGGKKRNIVQMIKIPGKYCTDDLSLKYMKLNKKSYSKVWKKLRTIHRKLRLVAVMISIRLIWSLGMC